MTKKIKPTMTVTKKDCCDHPDWVGCTCPCHQEPIKTEKLMPTGKKIEKNYECREYDGIKWIRYDHYLDAINSQENDPDSPKSSESWEEEFDQTFNYVGWIPEHKQRILDFISKIRQEAYEEGEQKERKIWSDNYFKDRDKIREEERTKKVLKGERNRIIVQLRAKVKEEVRRESIDILEALCDMYSQYCASNGHMFMGAGERACEILENYGLLNADSTGRGKINYDLLAQLKEEK